MINNTPDDSRDSQDVRRQLATTSSIVAPPDLNVGVSTGRLVQQRQDVASSVNPAEALPAEVFHKIRFLGLKLLAGEGCRFAATVMMSVTSWAYITYHFWTQPWFAGIVAISAGVLLCRVPTSKHGVWPPSDSDDAPELKKRVISIVDEVCAMHKMPKPDICIASTDSLVLSVMKARKRYPNVGLAVEKGGHGRLYIPDSVCRETTDQELRAIIGHELAHSLQSPLLLQPVSRTVFYSSVIPYVMTAALVTYSVCSPVTGGYAGLALSAGVLLVFDSLIGKVNRSLNRFCNHTSEYHADLTALTLVPTEPYTVIQAVQSVSRILGWRTHLNPDVESISHPSIAARRKNIESALNR